MRKITGVLVITLIAVISFGFVYQTVQAQCPDGTPASETITCAGTDTNGVDGGTGNDTYGQSK